MRRLVSYALIFASLALPNASWAVGDAPAPCAAPAEFTTVSATLGQFASAIGAGGPVAILAIGSATTVGSVSAGGDANTVMSITSFPWRMLQTLQAALPKIEFHLTVRGGRSMTAEAMLPLLQEALQEQHFPLVLWQTGTVEALRGMRPDALRAVLRTGAERVRDAGGDLVLIDPQFSRMLRANTDLDTYEAVLQQTATLPGVVLFRRFDLMRTWANAGHVDLERTPKEDRSKALDVLNTCLGEALARFVLSGAELQKK